MGGVLKTLITTFNSNKTMALMDLSKEELCLISIALNAYQMETDNYHLDEMKQISTRIDNTYKMCTCKEDKK